MYTNVNQENGATDRSLQAQHFLSLDGIMKEMLAKIESKCLPGKDSKDKVESNINSSDQDIFSKNDDQFRKLNYALGNQSVLNERLDQILINLFRLASENPTLANINIRNCNGIQAVQFKCERGMPESFGPRVVTSLDNLKSVLCDTETDGGGWIIIQRRIKDDVNFYRGWHSYKEGFGSLNGDFWLGNNMISNLTRKDKYELRIDMINGSDVYYATYASFMLADESLDYTLRLGNFSGGNITDSIKQHADMVFSTFDRNNKNSCASIFKSAWWYDSCYNSNLNGIWGLNDKNGIAWHHVNNIRMILNYVEMKIRTT